MQNQVTQGEEIQSLRLKTRQLQEKQQVLKAMLSQDEEANKMLFDELCAARKKLFNLQAKEYNEQSSKVDLGTYLQITELRAQIELQEKKIDSLNSEIKKQGLTGMSNNKQYIEVKQKLNDIEKQIAFGKKFISTQYFRHYFQLPQTYKISYEDVKLDYERKLKIKEGLEAEKMRYEERKKQLMKQTQERRNEYQNLTRQLEKLSD